MTRPTPVVVLTGGGSGGHITPLLSLAQELKVQSPDCQVIYIGHKGDKFDTFEQSVHDFDFAAFIRAGKFRRYGTLGRTKGIFRPSIFFRNLLDMLRIPGSILSSWRILRKFRPDVVFSKGSFVALPVGIAARLLRIPIVTHDSDTVPGLANRLIGRWATAHATGMPVEYYPFPRTTTHYVGIPIDKRITRTTPKSQKEFKKKLGLPADSNVLLVAGGSGGAGQLNELITEIASELLETNLSLQIIHLTGKQHETAVKAGYVALADPVRKRLMVSGYSDQFYALIEASDLVVTRAGATTMAELAAAGKACIVIPGAQLAGGHQQKNAEALAKQDAAVIMPAAVQADEMLAMINNLLNNDTRRFELARNLFATAKPEAASDLAKLILRIAKLRS
jgi:UDP-N-acetylglucosamine--N-acetylmuramyl-(pentapeptide) pyrophosphoryl-undecaprenol N-acetylglucosamine transferase